MLHSQSDAAVVRMLEQVPMFSSLSNKQIRGLANGAKERDYAEGALVVKQGEPGVGFYLVLDGKVEVRRRGRSLASLGPGQFFGEMSLLDQEPRTADVVATKPTRCLILSKWEFWGFAMGEPKVLRTILEEMARRLRDTNRALSE